MDFSNGFTLVAVVMRYYFKNINQWLGLERPRAGAYVYFLILFLHVLLAELKYLRVSLESVHSMPPPDRIRSRANNTDREGYNDARDY